jgi:hypothetical protein
MSLVSAAVMAVGFPSAVTVVDRAPPQNDGSSSVSDTSASGGSARGHASDLKDYAPLGRDIRLAARVSF